MFLGKFLKEIADLVVRAAGGSRIEVLDLGIIFCIHGLCCVHKDLSLRADQPDGTILIGSDCAQILVSVLRRESLPVIFRGPVGSNIRGFPVKLIAVYRFYMIFCHGAACKGHDEKANETQYKKCQDKFYIQVFFHLFFTSNL